MSDEHRPDEQTPDEQVTDQPLPGAQDEEPTQPLAGWRPTEPEPAPAAQPEGRVYGAADDAVPAHAGPDGPGADDAAAPQDGMLDGPPPHRAPFGEPQAPSQEQQPGAGHEPAAPTVPYPTQGPYPQQPGQPGQPWFGPGPQPRPMYAGPTTVSRKIPLWVWPAVACLALVVGMLGGLAGGAIQDELAARPGTNDNGINGVRTQTAAPLEADNGSVAAVAQALLPSTVQIVAELDGREGGATGSGFVLDREGHVVTNDHVVASAAEDDGPIVVIDHQGQRLEATVVGRSSVYDLAVLAVEGGGKLEPAALGASQVLRVGDPVIAFGAPLGLSQTVTSGIVSALNRPVTTSGQSEDNSSYINAVQTDAAINPGNSGGPLVNLAGEVVGVNSAIATNGGASGEAGNIGVGFAIPIEQVRTTVDQILRTGKAEYPVIGAQVRTGGEPDADGATITEVMPDTPAERAGLEKDDVITAVDDQPVNDGIALIVAIRTHLPGETVEMSVVRGGEERVVQVELDGKVG
ncbi:trypsin-like peptidase domain-containing protein [Nocardioides cavernae]|uniref:Trypsin-like peptidase domain-containing protein n=1 Tax=Nocardioides cavernae TaxID=1921566 RepID=A0ABR8NE95_9ACTN|nr:trypsin-like peptidase domain-containing protein [Nocardioides cavernae]MBD3926453.1 trypsin-like peptidase domain-containing protein [Nocardioides cavernae]MBM7512172.1 putative serine protease PepD [Nocardioides cavernae]